MFSFTTRGGTKVFLAREAVASMEETYMGDRGLATIIRTFDGRRFEVGDSAERLARQLEACAVPGEREGRGG